MSQDTFDKPPRVLDLLKVPNEPWYRSAYLISHAAAAASTDAADWIENSYHSRERLRAHLRFLPSALVDGPRGDVESLARVWFFPWTEAASELELSFACALAGLHRGCVDHQRRALELTVVGAYFVADHIDAKNGAAWLTSELRTPFFSRALDSLARTGFCERLNAATQWLEAVKQHYWLLSDIVHVRGQQFGLNAVQPMHLHLSTFPVPEFNAEALCRTLDRLIDTCGHIAIALVVANPILLVGLPISAKYGLNEPLGFSEDGQAEKLRSLVPTTVRDQIVALAEADPTIQSIRDYMHNLPDISEEDVRRQIQDFESRLGNA